jgi:hypothetical protein
MERLPKLVIHNLPWETFFEGKVSLQELLGAVCSGDADILRNDTEASRGSRAL